ncbi:MAG: LysM peptidoglycan-binding domain-containing protein [Dehalococcoidia bacterium]
MRKMIIILAVVSILGLLTTTVGYAAPPYGPTYHRVRRGETLFAIGRRYGVHPYAIARANNLQNPNRIYAGQVLRIPTTSQPQHRIHIVVRGQTLLRIARRYGVSAWRIAQANGIWNLNRIYAGQRLVIP